MDDVLVVSNLVKCLPSILLHSFISPLSYWEIVVYQPVKLNCENFLLPFIQFVNTLYMGRRIEAKVMIAKHKIVFDDDCVCESIRSYKIIKTKMVYYHDWLLTLEPTTLIWRVESIGDNIGIGIKFMIIRPIWLGLRIG